MRNALVYRQATPVDASSLSRLAIASWQRLEPDLGPDNWKDLSQALNKVDYATLAQTTYGALCVNDHGEIVGMSFLVPSGNPTDIFPSDWSYVRMVTVHPLYNGRGIGRELMTLCIDYARNAGEKVIGLHTSEVMNAARHIYERMGFEIVRELGLRYGKRYWLYRMDL